MAESKLEVQPWYHGLLPREDIKLFLHEKGDFLVRMSEPSSPGKREFVLSVMYDKDAENGVKHFVIHQKDGKCSLEKNACFGSVMELVNHFVSSKTSITLTTKDVILKRPVERRPWQLNHADIELTKKLGEGAYGEVHKGFLKRKHKFTGTSKVDVAVKIAKLDVITKEQIKDIMREARLMRFFDHPNIVKLYGVAAVQEPLMLVMELASNGALNDYLQKEKGLGPAKKVEMCYQAALGVEYLHLQNCLHRDIASRNCLYGNGLVKISDFGLSRQGTVYQMNPSCKVPIKWLAPETLKMAMYSQKTDVWSYGIMCWEIFHNGIEPYPGMNALDVNTKVKEGYRMNVADCQMPPEMQNMLLKRVWTDSPNDRFSMADVVKALEKIVQKTSSNEASNRMKKTDASKTAVPSTISKTQRKQRGQ